MSIFPDLLHEEYDVEGDLILFRCRECGQTSMSLGALHGHCEKHRGYTRWGISLPFTESSPGNFDQLMELTEVLRVEETAEIDLEDVDGL
ncbi:hypothetical protein [Natronomonas sp. LN261]|uniref:hypothetical protein n=1 Tax=Natronomonas sp. LN261 TaxID=2750669 RepID=UPI0015EFC1F4|nr:hypothetical protein [Natronomonas sp. LN261]